MDVTRGSPGWEEQCWCKAVDLIPVINAAADSVRLAADAKGLELRLLLDPAAGMISDDAARVHSSISSVGRSLTASLLEFVPLSL